MAAPDTALRLKDVLRETLAPLLPRGEPYALLDYPAYANIGDSAIWLGAIELLREHGAGAPAYTCSAQTYDAATLRRLVGSGPILITGGGNFGDLYEANQSMRERVVCDFADNRVVQLPQTLRYEREEALAASRQVFAAHPDFTLAVRDETSLALARDELGVRTLLAPDLAFALAPLPRPEPHGDHVVWLLRADDESRRDGELPDGVETVDWPRNPRRGLSGIQRKLSRRVGKAPSRRTLLANLLRRTYDPMAQRRLDRGCAILGAGRAVVTDRLHGHILCVLMGLPHVVLDNSYGKNRAFLEAWTQDAPGATWCGDVREAAGALSAPAWRSSAP